VIKAMTNDARNDAQRALYVLLSGPKLRRPAARSVRRVEALRRTLEER
jgi:hypothetical protein